MEYQMNGHIKLCATCEYWVGPRQPNFYGNMVVLPQQSIYGKCWCLTGPFKRTDRLSNSSVCNYYQKWSVLKQSIKLRRMIIYQKGASFLVPFMSIGNGTTMWQADIAWSRNVLIKDIKKENNLYEKYANETIE